MTPQGTFMTEPTTPTPSGSAPAPASGPLGRAWIALIIALVLVLGLGGAAYGVHHAGNSKADDYAKALSAWDGEKDKLVSAPTTATSGLWDFGKSSEDKSVAKQKVACARVDKLRKSVAKDANALPTTGGGLFKVLSSSYRKAAKNSAAREKAARAYAKAADSMLAQLHKDCLWNIRYNSSDSGSKKYWDQAEKLVLKNGHSEGGITCSDKRDCVPATSANRVKYADLRLKANKIDETYYLKLVGDGACAATSYGKVCEAMKADWVTYYDNEAHYNTLVKHSNSSDPGIAKEITRLEKSNAAATKKFKAALDSLHPEFKTDKRLSKSPFWTEAYFDASTKKAIVGLTKLSKAFSTK